MIIIQHIFFISTFYSIFLSRIRVDKLFILLNHIEGSIPCIFAIFFNYFFGFIRTQCVLIVLFDLFINFLGESRKCHRTKLRVMKLNLLGSKLILVDELISLPNNIEAIKLSGCSIVAFHGP